jgi:NAD(P)-dependent dehydrogenase (short-subunit alcohol dehydrogenase family)
MTATGPLSGRIALVTGASRGIGRAAALALAEAGAHVVLLARTVGGLEEVDDLVRAKGGTATLLPMDLEDGAKLDALGPSLYQRWQKLDILVANAAVLGPLSPLTHIRDADWQRVMRVNVDAMFRLIRTLDPLLRLSDAGRAVFVTSGAAQKCPAYWGPYSVSKAALDALVKTYAAEVANSAVRANLLSPGPVRTAMRKQAFPGEDPASLPPPEALAPLFLEMVSPRFTENGATIDFGQWRARAR